jgi:hypothetical protein
MNLGNFFFPDQDDLNPYSDSDLDADTDAKTD